MKSIKLLTATVALAIFSFSAFAADMKVGLVDKQVLGSESLYAKSVNEKMQKEFGPRQESLMSRDKELRSKFEQLERDKDVLSESDRVKKEREIAKMQQSLQEDGQSLQEDFARRQEKEAQAFDKIVNNVLEQIAKEEKLDMILNQQAALFGGQKSNYTYKALQMLDKQYKTAKK